MGVRFILLTGMMLTGVSTAFASEPVAALTRVTTYPAGIVLDGPLAEQRIGVLGDYADGRQSELSRIAKFTTSSPTIARIDGQIVRSVGNGTATITVDIQGKQSTIPVTVTHATADVPVSFSREVEPILTRLGCNQGACHGAQHGRGGFRLSLRGFDPVFDHQQIVQSAEGRRVVLSDPERSIVLAKPTLVMEHGGGERVSKQSRAYATLLRWLDDGAPEPSTKDPIVTAVEVWPPRRVMVPGEEQQIFVRATWSDGRVEDVTETASFDSLNDAVAAVTPGGLVSAKGRGETHIMIRFEGQATVVQITLPYAQLASYPNFPVNNLIDEKVLAKWKALGITPSPLAGDAEFFRRIHLDTLGVLPTPEEIKAFLADSTQDKRSRAVDRVLNRPEFIDFWTLKWGDLLLINRDELQDKGMWSFHNWVRASLRDGKPIDQFVREIITSEGSRYTEGPVNFFANGREWSEATTQIFLGVRLQCAKCHHHPFEKWSQDDYYGMNAFFIRLGTKNSQEFGLFGREGVVYLKQTGEQTHPRKGTMVKPHPLDGPEMDDPFDRRRKLAEWLTTVDNPFFARNLVNRFWGYYFGRGLVEPLDDMRATNPASNPELLVALSKDFAQHKFDLKYLLRTMMTSRVYQLSDEVTPGNAADSANVHFARCTVKRLTAEQVADAIDFATGTREKYPGLPLGTRAVQLPDTAVKSYLMDLFGRPPRKVTCECERSTQPNMAQALHLLNGDFLNRKIAEPTGRVEKLLATKKPVSSAIEELYLVTLSRPPQAAELSKAERWVASAKTPRDGLQDLLWVLLNSKEFLFNH